MIFEPRSYQNEAIDAIYEVLCQKQNALLVAFMGSGKTAMAVKIIERVLEKMPVTGKILILAHKSVLLQQFKNAFEKFTKILSPDVGLCCADLDQYDMGRRITIASVMTFANRAEKYQGAKLIVIDEAHRIDITNDSQYKKTIEILRDKEPLSRILGITATPFRLGHGYIYGDHCKPGNDNLFEKIDHRITYADLLEQGFLMPITGHVADSGSLTEDLKSVNVKGDYAIGDLGDLMSQEIHIETAVEALKKFGESCKHVIVLCTTIDHAEHVHQAMLDAEESCTILHSQLKKTEKLKNKKDWEAGIKRTIVTINMIIEGYDFPPADCLLMLRPTMSAALFLQSLGRIARISAGKETATLIDCTPNTSNFGTDLDAIQVKIPSQRMEDDEIPTTKTCPLCESILYCSARVCPCGYKFGEETIPAKYLPKMKEVAFAMQPVVNTWEVNSMKVNIHLSKNSGKELIRIDFNCSEAVSFAMITITLWLCLPDFYEGYAVEKTREKLAMFGIGDIPECVTEGLDLQDIISQPDRLTVKEVKDGKYTNYEILEVHYDDSFDQDCPF